MVSSPENDLDGGGVAVWRWRAADGGRSRNLLRGFAEDLVGSTMVMLIFSGGQWFGRNRRKKVAVARVLSAENGAVRDGTAARSSGGGDAWW